MNQHTDKQQAKDKSKAQFIADQHLYQLQLTPEERHDVLQHLTLKSLAKDEELHLQTQRPSDVRSPWKRVRDRFGYLARLGSRTQPTGRRLCITAYAGVGKSKALEQLCVVRPELCPEQTVLHYRFEDLPRKAEDFLSLKAPGSLILHADQIIAATAGQHASPILRQPTKKQLQSWLQGIARGGRLTLAVDALDEVSKEDGKVLAKSLADFLARFPRVHCVVAGRPYAICEDFWFPLFTNRSGSRVSAWEFCRTGSLTRIQMERFLGGELLRQLEPLLASTPDNFSNTRILEILRTFEPDILEKLRSTADVYWYSIDKAMKWDKQKPGQIPQTKLEIADILAIYAAIAFTSLQGSGRQQKKHAGNIAGANDRADATTLQLNGQNTKIIRGRIARALDLGSPDDRKTRQQAKSPMKKLLKLSEHFVEFRYFIVDDVQFLRWSNATYREFFAALWLTRYADQNDLQWLQDRQNSAEMRQVWQFLCGMPKVADTDPDNWIKIIQPLFETRNTLPNPTPRPTELLVLAWPQLLKWAGFLTKDDWTEADLQLATYHAQQDAKNASPQNAEDNSPDLELSCEGLVRQFLGEYPALRSAKDTEGHGTLAARICHEDLESQFRDCKSFAGRTFYAGDGESHGSGPVTQMTLDAAVKLCAVPVTRRLYALFDANHAGQFGDYDTVSPDPCCPAIYLSYWDSVMFSIWSHSRLPTEWEWEYAARAGKDQPGNAQPIWWWGNDESQLVKYAWLRNNSGGTTHPVGGLRANPKPYELYDMLGNVWEWTSSLFRPGDPSSVSRVVRGGSFHDVAVYARCSFRDGLDPSDSFFTGCRVARADF